MLEKPTLRVQYKTLLAAGPDPGLLELCRDAAYSADLLLRHVDIPALWNKTCRFSAAAIVLRLRTYLLDGVGFEALAREAGAALILVGDHITAADLESMVLIATSKRAA